MKDIHCHLLYGIDDGSSSIEESINIIKNAYNQNITDIIITPHYMKNTKYNCNNETKQELFNILKDKVKENNIDINLYLGNEVYICEDMIDLIKNNEIKTLNDSRYILFEFPLNNMHSYSKNLMFELIRNGYVPVLAHPERYKIFKEHPEHIKDYLSLGVLLQGNYMSLYGKYGLYAKKVFKKYLKLGYYTFLGSDNHHDTNYHVKNIEKDLYKVCKSKEYINDLINNNIDKVINNEKINTNYVL